MCLDNSIYLCCYTVYSGCYESEQQLIDNFVIHDIRWHLNPPKYLIRHPWKLENHLDNHCFPWHFFPQETK
jgi:hypothetical protein